MKKKVFLLGLILIFALSLSVQAQIRVGQFPQNVEDEYVLNPDTIEIEAWQQNLDVPWELVFLPESNRALISERDGRVLQVENGNLKSETYLELDIDSRGEGGLMGMVHHPDFPETPYIYLMYTYTSSNSQLYNRVSRFTDQGNQAVEEEIIIDQIPAGNNHNGGRIAFGPDGMLYITTGETFNREIAQDLDNLGGKILRLTPEGTIPDDNPFGNSPVYSLGHRNPQGIAWHPETGDLFISDHGPSGEDGLRAKDRIKVVEAGSNFGWPDKIGYFEDGEYANPLIMWEDTVPPSGMTFYRGDLYVGTLGSQSLVRIGLNRDKDEYNVESIEHLFNDGAGSATYGRIRKAVVGPDGYLYFLTNNRDGRGRPRENDDQILRFRLEE
ncbi:sorbosone dehydrogenase family protein [Halanaerobium sp. ST460_2HS_T2]|jgi:quinoprotein glucose dehydrogenase|uniref:PQQ-dependent sugar dehydrogenase n=1 Tax=Halanaerobium sp. ST460_2HS_T2 TaxID=2183914 RepID=UPI000DF44F16|nr:PQQ-dependent sugar dehydrogenase [Halanaerobium sp. ST460_2HS_T2]RCW62400.1 quinoprotein glucose dehydrogenase [Halanaerobium sp. ST460_2HS_T2]